MFVVIAGGGRTGSQLAQVLIRENHTVRIVENRKELISRIHRELPTEVVHEGNPMDLKVLEKVGIKRADVLAAVTSVDEENLVLCYLARTCYNIGRTIARVNNPRDAWVFSDTFKVDVAVNSSAIMAHLIQEEMSMGDMTTIIRLRRGNYSLVEEKIQAGAPAIGVAVKDLGLPERCILAGIFRHEEVIVPRGITILEENDEVMAVTDTEGARILSALLSPPPETPVATNGRTNHQ